VRAAFSWGVVAAGIAACAMFLGALSRGRADVPMYALGALGAGVAVAGGRAVARERVRAARERERAEDRRRRRPRRTGRIASVLLLALGAVAAVAAGYLASLVL
jgi:hypothetical protein